jgi:D-glycero-D-manno-heptose 1,7-bisphosphate phosphatase
VAEAPRPAVFLDRDGTIIHDPGFLHDPDDVHLLPGAAAAIARLNDAGDLVVCVSNQSGIARGLFDEAAYQAVQRRLEELLAAAGARLDASYHCPHYPPVSGPCACRKPGTELFTQAAARLRADLARSWWIGDRMSDVTPAGRLGGRGILVLTGEGARHEADARRSGIAVAPDLAAAVGAALSAR